MALLKNVVIKADEQTNALIITAAPDVMRSGGGGRQARRAPRAGAGRSGDRRSAGWAGAEHRRAVGNKYGGGTQFAGSAPGVSAGFEMA